MSHFIILGKNFKVHVERRGGDRERMWVYLVCSTINMSKCFLIMSPSLLTLFSFLCLHYYLATASHLLLEFVTLRLVFLSFPSSVISEIIVNISISNHIYFGMHNIN